MKVPLIKVLYSLWYLITSFQVVHKNLQDALEDSNTLKQQVEEYALQLGRVQELLEQKVLLCILCTVFCQVNFVVNNGSPPNFTSDIKRIKSELINFYSRVCYKNGLSVGRAFRYFGAD